MFRTVYSEYTRSAGAPGITNIYKIQAVALAADVNTW